MARKREDLTGQKFNRLTVLSWAGNGKWQCVCKCGKTKEVSTSNLRGTTKSCGCLNTETRQKLARKRNRKHGLCKKGQVHPLYSTWYSMISRCHNEQDKSYPRYGGRGIRVCKRWKNSFRNFINDMGDRPEDHSLDRVNNDRDYKPSNCRWASVTEQANNRRNNHIITYNGQTKTLAEWCRVLNLPYRTIYARVRSGKDPVESLLQPINQNMNRHKVDDGTREDRDNRTD